MVLGFGFNKTKVFSAAEKFVQQGKLQNAIVEYEKISKEDPKDLTVLNTIGDLYSRIGQVEQAVVCFRKVGDSYAAQGFTVKAIAMYKKLTKLSPSAIECTQKLAELYTQQGLYNDARSQYVQVADSHMRNGNLEDAARIFQKMLELDPENAAMQTKLADLYVKLGKKEDAKNIFFRAAESLHDRNSLTAADDSLGKVLALDPQNARALEMRAEIALESGNAGAAITYLEQLPDLDSRGDALRLVMNAYVKAGRTEEAEPIARKLFVVHHDTTGISAYGDYLLAGGRVNEALKFYVDFEDRLLASNSEKFTEALYGCVSRVKDDAKALDAIRNIFTKAGDTRHTAEITELLAHALVQVGELERSRDLYKELMGLEPENPLHAQNHRQIITRLGTDPAARPLTAEEGGQAFLVDELEPVNAVVVQEYPEEITNSIQTALTESELFDSYNVPSKAIPPLEFALPRAPKDIRLNQRLASLYARTGRLGDAARCCVVLEEVYRIGGFREEARQFRDMAEKYAEKAGIELPDSAEIAAPAVVEHEAIDFGDLPLAEDENALAASAKESGAGEASTRFIAMTPEEATTGFVASSVVPQAEVEEIEVLLPMVEAAPEAVFEPDAVVASAETEAVAHEFDLSDEWEMSAAEPSPALVETRPVIELVPAAEDAATSTETDDLVEEISFYLAQSMLGEASAALEKLAAVAPHHASLAGFRAQLAAATTTQSSTDVVIEGVEPVAEVDAMEVAEDASIAEFLFDADALGETEVVHAETTPVFDAPVLETSAPEPVFPELEEAPAILEIEAPQPEPEIFEVPLASPATEPVLDVELEPLMESAVPIVPSPVAAAKQEPETLSDFVLDLEESLGDDFTIAAPAKPAAVVAAPVATTPVAPIAAAAAPALVPEVNIPEADAGETSVAEEANSVLADMFAEFKEDVEESEGRAEDPDTHYNLGVAFKEMGLLDEAIGELQKVSQAIERGAAFSQTMQVYTWLAQCFVDKGVPEASYRWYEKALQLANDDETRTAIHYEFACAHEIAGNNAQALAHFTEVYGSNIDYRDVAERIKALKS